MEGAGASPEMEGTGESPPSGGIPESGILPDDLDAQAEASVAVKVRRGPTAPARLEMEEHEAACLAPYRNWCVPCAAGRDKADPHRGRDHTEDGGITMGIDYLSLIHLSEPTRRSPHPYAVIGSTIKIYNAI